MRGDRAAETASPGFGSSVSYPCSRAQRTLWSTYRRKTHDTGQVVVASWRIDGYLADATIEQASYYLIARHECLRTRIDLAGDDPVQIVAASVPFKVSFYDLRGLRDVEARNEANRLLELEDRTPFDLFATPLFRVSHIKLADDRSEIVLSAHRMICDLESLAILVREMGEIASTIERREPISLSIRSVTYRQSVEEEEARLTAESFAQERGSAHAPLMDYVPFELLADRPRLVQRMWARKSATKDIEHSTSLAIADLARRNDTTTRFVYLATLLTLLHRYSGDTDIAIGTELSARETAESRDIVGCFLNVSLLRADLSGDPTFLELLGRLNHCVREALNLASLPSGSVAKLAESRPNALFSVLFTYEGFRERIAPHASFILTELRSFSGVPTDLNFVLSERSDGLRLSCVFNAELFDRDTIRRLLECFTVLLRAVSAGVEETISTLPLVEEAERNRLIEAPNRTRARYRAEQTVTDMFAEWVALTPMAAAVVCGETTLTYAELDRASNRLARELAARGLGGGGRIGVLLERSLDLVIALLAIIKAGSAYVPLDPAYPIERLRSISDDARLSGIVSRTRLSDLLSTCNSLLVDVDADAAEILQRSSKPVGPSATAEDPIYMIFTSGSTGRPKGVPITHRSLVNLLSAMSASGGFGITSSDVLVAVTTIAFDMGILEVFLPLANGACLVVARDEEVVENGALIRLLEATRATIMQATPVKWQLLIEAGWNGNPPLKMLCGGEAISRRLADQLLERGRELWNGYGPTETTIYSSISRVAPGDGPVLIGPPLSNTQFYVLDANREPVPYGAPGELFIGGDGVAAGYFERPELTQERFLSDPFRDAFGALLFRTGDIVRHRGAAHFEFLGRSDRQVKIRGVRIELEEVENALLRQSDVREAVTIVRSNSVQEKSLWAFVVPRGEVELSGEGWIANLRLRLCEILPAYMVPSPLAMLNALPRTPNGKIDRNALVNFEYARKSELREPQFNAAETAITDLVESLLGREVASRHDDLFALGLHSLLAIRLVDRIEATFGARMPLSILYDGPTIAQIALALSPAAAPMVSRTRSIVTLNPLGTQPPFIYLHNDLLADGMYVRRLAVAVGDAHPIHAIAPHGTADLASQPTIELMASDHIARIRDLQPTGPYRLGGYCASGLVAYEMARLLRGQGETIELLVLINALPAATRSNRIADLMIRSIGLSPYLPARARQFLCYKVARLSDLLAESPRNLFSAVLRMVARISKRFKAETPDELAKSEIYAEQVVATLTFHPQKCDADVTVIWSANQDPSVDDVRERWKAVADNIRILEVPGSHVSPLQDGVEEFGLALAQILDRR